MHFVLLAMTWLVGAGEVPDMDAIVGDDRFQTDLPDASASPSSARARGGGSSTGRPGRGPAARVPVVARSEATGVSVASRTVATVLVVVIVAALLAVLAFAIVNAIRERSTVRPPGAAEGVELEPPEAVAGEYADVERLVRDGRFGEALHALLLVALARVRIDPSLTSREALACAKLPDGAREPLHALVVAVERSWFGGRRVDEAAFRESRRQYDAFSSAYGSESS